MELKTPVSLLQEWSMKEGFIPNYKLIYNGTGSHDPLFHWEVSVKGKSAIGKGKSKKEAKHEAAKMLLLQMKDQRVFKDNVQIVSPYANITGNAVGQLSELCVKRSIVAPKYEVVRDEGLPHCKIFGVRCLVTHFSTEGEACTKKQAKHVAAQKMLKKLKQGLTDEQIKLKAEAKKQEEVIMTEKACKVTEQAFTKRKRSADNTDSVSSTAVGTPMSNFSENFVKNVLPFSETLRNIVHCDDTFLANHQNPEILLKTIASQLHYQLKYSFLDTKTCNLYLCNLHIPELNNADFIGMAETQIVAKRKATLKALEFMLVMSRT